MGNWCCEELRHAVDDEELIAESVWGKSLVLQKMASANEGDGYVERWVDKEYMLKYCPFCGTDLRTIGFEVESSEDKPPERSGG